MSSAECSGAGLSIERLFLGLDLDPFVFDLEAQAAENAHVDVCNPNQREEADEISTPAIEQQLVPRHDHEENRDPVAEAVFTGEQVKEFPDKQAVTGGALVGTPFARLAEDLFVRHGPGDARDGNCEDEKRDDLCREIYDAEPPPC